MKRINGTPTMCAIVLIGAVAAAAQSAITSIVSPTEGDSFHVGDTMHIAWTVDESQLTQGVVVEISFDAGDKWYQISPGEAMPNTTRDLDFPVTDSLTTYDFDLGRMATVPAVSDSVLLFVYEYDNEGISSGVLHIVPNDTQAVISTMRTPQTAGSDIVAQRSGLLMVTAPARGRHEVMVLDGQGRRLRQFTGTGPATYTIPDAHLAPGMYVAIIRSTERNAIGRFTLAP